MKSTPLSRLIKQEVKKLIKGILKEDQTIIEEGKIEALTLTSISPDQEIKI